MRLQEELDFMIHLIRAAAQQEILPRFGKVTGRLKGRSRQFRDIVTEADLAASHYILQRIQERFPGSYSEEHKNPHRFDYDMLWQIDPIDGTDEFCLGMAEGYAVNAALLQRQQDGTYHPVAGIVYIPSTDTVWWSDGKTIYPTPTHDRTVLAGWVRAVDPNERLQQCYHHLSAMLHLPLRLMMGGGAGASIADLLSGKTNLVIMNYNYTKEWDVAMAEPLLEAAGGWICDLAGASFTYNRPDSHRHDEPYNLKGYIASIVFTKEEILPHLPSDLLIDRL